MSVAAESGQAYQGPLKGAVAQWWERTDQLLERAGDRLNPILVKETRQALKSKQFLITFALLLVFGWGWTLLGIALMGPEATFTTPGPDMFIAYFALLAFPLTVIVPFGAFRSLAGEQEDRTYELLSITTLNPRQIIMGKLGSAVLQMLVYLSAIAPCLAFTYLLRGIDIITILFLLVALVLGSLGLSMIALFFGTLTTEKHWQILLSVLVVAGLFSAFGSAIGIAVGTMEEADYLFPDVEFWQAMAALLTGYVSYFALIYYAAAARLTFESDNRSSRLRVVMLLQYALFVGWMAWVTIGPARGEEEVFMIFIMFAAFHWFIMGAFMTGESPELSSRVKRSLPQSFLGRVFLTWFNPGPGTGYVFAVASMASAVALVAVAVFWIAAFDPWELSRFNGDEIGRVLVFSAFTLAYVIFYLGLGLLLMRLMRRFSQVNILVSVLIHPMLVLVGVVTPRIVLGLGGMLDEFWNSPLMMITCPFTAPVLIGGHDIRPFDPVTLLTLALVSGGALLVFVLNLPAVAEEVRQVRIARPWRVEQEDAALAPPKPRVRTSPWDE